jgi:lipoprotein-anchoring transpeptidase ErfK/SrfK
MRSPRARRLLAAAAVAAGVSGATLASLVACSARPAAEVGEGSSPEREGDGSSLADPEPPAFTVPVPVPLQASRFDSTWATVRLATAVRAAPRGEAPIVARLDPWTPEETTNLVLTLDRRKDAQGSLWIRVRFPGFPDNTTGWVPRRTLGGGGVVRTRLVVDLGDRRATLFRRGRPVFHSAVGIGTATAPTPTGDFYIRNKLTRYRSAFYGPIAFGTSARSPTLTDWPAGGFVGIHGTSRPDLVPGAVSHGCIRMRNADIVRLARLLRIGSPLTIRA